MILKSVLKIISETKYTVIDNEEHDFETIKVDYLAPIEEFSKSRRAVEKKQGRTVKFITVNTATHILEITLQ